MGAIEHSLSIYEKCGPGYRCQRVSVSSIAISLGLNGRDSFQESSIIKCASGEAVSINRILVD